MIGLYKYFGSHVTSRDYEYLYDSYYLKHMIG